MKVQLTIRCKTLIVWRLTNTLCLKWVYFVFCRPYAYYNKKRPRQVSVSSSYGWVRAVEFGNLLASELLRWNHWKLSFKTNLTWSHSQDWHSQPHAINFWEAFVIMIFVYIHGWVDVLAISWKTFFQFPYCPSALKYCCQAAQLDCNTSPCDHFHIYRSKIVRWCRFVNSVCCINPLNRNFRDDYFSKFLSQGGYHYCQCTSCYINPC